MQTTVNFGHFQLSLRKVKHYLTVREGSLRQISCHGRNYSQPYFFKINQSSDNRSHGFGVKFLLKKLSASDFSYERKSPFSLHAKYEHYIAKIVRILGILEDFLKVSILCIQTRSNKK